MKKVTQAKIWIVVWIIVMVANTFGILFSPFGWIVIYPLGIFGLYEASKAYFELRKREGQIVFYSV